MENGRREGRNESMGERESRGKIIVRSPFHHDMHRLALVPSLAGPTCALLLFPASAKAQDADAPLSPVAAIERRLPPVSELTMPGEKRKKIERRLRDWRDRLRAIEDDPLAADLAIFPKAVEWALEHGEFYSEKHFALPREMLDRADARFAELMDYRKAGRKGEAPSWTRKRGNLVRGHRSGIDGSWQPFGLHVPEGLDLSEPVPLLVWLHGRGDKITDLHFIQRNLGKSAAFGGFAAEQEDCIVLHPFGRQCVGWKHAGEIDVFEAIARVAESYPIDPERIALAGFSMGGAGAWHIDAHYRDRFCAVHAGAGFADVARYLRLALEDYPPEHEQILWRVYDVPNYVRNFTNGPVLAYSGELDKQKNAADIMEAELAKVGHELRHLVGEGMGHKYREDAVEEIWQWLEESWEEGNDPLPAEIVHQTRTLRYPQHHWLRLTDLEKHWEDTLATGEWKEEEKLVSLELKNVASLEIRAPGNRDLAEYRIEIDGEALTGSRPDFSVGTLSLRKTETGWAWGEPEGLRKRPGLQGPIDDAFLGRFVVVPPEKAPASPRLARWVDFELDHFRSRWKALMRAELPEADAGDREPLAETRRRGKAERPGSNAGANLVLWGDPASNPAIADLVDRLPIEWGEKEFTFRGETWSTEDHVPAFIFPHPDGSGRYVVINSGLTFREGHDRTNSLQNPKLPDWAVIGLDRDPDGLAPGRIAAAGFFDEKWE